MIKVAILTDSNSGITQAQSKEMGVTVIPMPFFIDGEQYFEDINLTQEEFYKNCRKMLIFQHRSLQSGNFRNILTSF